MGVVETIPADLAALYAGDYYESPAIGTGYEDYEATAEHSLAWMSLLVDMLAKPGSTVLDVGCANGHLLRALRGRRRLGIEPHPAMASEATAAGLEIIASDILDAHSRKVAEGACDVVTAIAVLEHLTDFRAGFEAIASCLTSDGVLIFEVPLLLDDHDDSIWFQTSLEHIWYPNERSLHTLVATRGNLALVPLPCHIEGFGWTFVGVASPDTSRLGQVRQLIDRALLGPIELVTDRDERRLRLLYDVIYRAAPRSSHEALADAIDAGDATIGMVRRLMTLLANSADRTEYLSSQQHSLQTALDDAMTAVRETEIARDWHRSQAQGWEEEATRLAGGGTS